MSGITGLYYFNQREVAPQVLGAMLERIARRGPDVSGAWMQGAVGLANCLLWSTPESLQEKLPLVSASGDCVIVADARVDNRAELLPQLGLADRPAGEVTDSQLILAAYQKWGQDCLPHLVGDFAFAIWDERSQTIFCGRDVFGVRPFYYYLSHDLFAFSSEIKSLLVLPEVSGNLNEAAIVDYMTEMFDDKTRTFYADIYRLAPGHSLTANPRNTESKRYWSFDPERELRLKSNDEYAEAYRDVFVEAVRCRIRSVYPVGSTLSGGLDSSSITTVAGKLMADEGRQLHTFSAIFEESPESDERPFMQAVLDQGHYQPHFVRGDLTSPVVDLPRLQQVQDEPFYAPHLFLNTHLWSTAHESGVRVFMEGLMGDNIVGHGFPYLNHLARTGHWLELSRQIQLLAQNHANPQPVWKLTGRYIWQDGIRSRVPAPMLRAWRRLRGRPVEPTLSLPAILDPAFARRFALMERLRAMDSHARQGVNPRRAHYQDIEYGLIPIALEIYSRGSATFLLDVRFPYLDKRFAEFCLALPADQLLAGGYSRMIVRRGLGEYLPDKIRWRSGKGDLSHNLYRLLKIEHGQLMAQISESAPRLEGYINLPVLKKWAARIETGQASHDEVLSVYLAVVLGNWLCSRNGV